MSDLTQQKYGRSGLVTEFLILFILTPTFFYFFATRWNIHLALWCAAIYAVFRLNHKYPFSWRDLWQGTGWTLEQKKAAILRFCVAAPLLILLTYFVAPARMFSFPMQRPWFWLLIMIVYPILSVTPQEFVFRSFFFRRYEALFANKWVLIAVNGFCFGFLHIVFHNFVSPTLCLIGGTMFAYSYSQHRSLKWSVIEHAVYGCFVFTVGIGFYFLVGGATRL